METIEVLRGVRELLADPARWTQHNSAKNQDGCGVSPSDPSACSFCLLAAILRQTNHPGAQNAYFRAQDEIRATVKPLGFGSVMFFNDDADTTHEMVLAVLDTTIKKLETA